MVKFFIMLNESFLIWRSLSCVFSAKSFQLLLWCYWLQLYNRFHVRCGKLRFWVFFCFLCQVDDQKSVDLLQLSRARCHTPHRLNKGNIWGTVKSKWPLGWLLGVPLFVDCSQPLLWELSDATSSSYKDSGLLQSIALLCDHLIGSIFKWSHRWGLVLWICIWGRRWARPSTASVSPSFCYHTSYASALLWVRLLHPRCPP